VSGVEPIPSALLDYLEANHPSKAVAAAVAGVRQDLAEHGRPGLDEFVASFAGSARHEEVIGARAEPTQTVVGRPARRPSR
jgi:hypothetical protein